jgi:hypothetical protein
MARSKRRSKKIMVKKNKIELVIFLVVLIILILIVSIYLFTKKKAESNNFNSIESDKRSGGILTPSPYPIPHGKIEFNTSQSDRTVPQLRKGSIDPYDPTKGAIQTITITVMHTQPVTKVTAVLKTDHSVSSPVPFTLVSGTNTNGEWKGSWRITDTYLYTYKLVLQAESAGSKPAIVKITLR